MRVELGEALREARSTRRLTLEAASRAARISQGYLHKLEAGRVENPSPRVLQRLSEVLDIPYRRLMELADYVLPADQPARAPGPEEETTMPIQTQTDAPTNRQLMRLLQSTLDELAELKRGQQELAQALTRLAGSP
ncbi:hypothetical protein BH20ACT18_BH20ACT18_06220 [soil metagenome]